MRRLLTVLVLAAMAAAVSSPAWADNQATANRVASTLRDSGKLGNYKIEVKFQKGTAWLKGHVHNQAQMNTALRLTLQTPGVEQVINDLEISAPSAAAPTPAAVAKNPVRTSDAFEDDTEAFAAIGQQELSLDSTPADLVASSYDAPPVPQTAQPVPVTQAPPTVATRQPRGTPIPVAYRQPSGEMVPVQAAGAPIPAYVVTAGGAAAPASYDQPNLPNNAWPSYAPYPNYASLTYPKQYSPTAWPYIGPFYPYPQVPLGWRKVTLEWDDGWWMLDFKDSPSCW